MGEVPVDAAGERRGRGAMMPMRSGLFLPVFDELADPAAVAGLSAGAEEAGCVIARGAEIDWDQPGRFPYDRTHAEL